MDSSFYDRFYSQMTKGTFVGMSRATPEKFQFSIKAPETITHVKRLDVNKGAIMLFEEFLDKISPLKIVKKLGAILFQLPPSFTVNDFKNIEQFLDKLPTADGYDYAIEFRHPSWGTEGPWEMLRHYNIAAVMTVIMAERQSLTQCKFKEMIGVSLSTDEKRVMEKAKGHILG